jgi:hypothetical protein
MLGPDFEWIEQEVPGYPLAGVHRGPDGLGGILDRLEATFEDLAVGVDEVIETDDRLVATGAIHGRPPGTDVAWVLPFAHVWELADGEPVRANSYFDRSRLTLAASRRQLADVADDLLEQAAEIRRQWARLGNALRAAGADTEEESGEPLGEPDAEPPFSGTASVRLAAVDMAADGATREEVEAFLREEHGVEDSGPILDEVFGAAGGEPSEQALEERAAAIEAKRLSRLFARNRG